MPAQQTTNTMDSMYQAPIYREKQVKMIQERISQVEKQFGDLCQIFGSLSRKLSKMRDTGDKLAKAVADYSTYERFNATTKSSLKDFSIAYAAIQDFRDVEVKRLESKVIHPLSNYGDLCKKTRESLKQANNALNKEMKQRKSLDSARERNPSNTQRLSHVNMELERAAQDATMRTKQVEIEMDQFERRKLADMKKILMDYVNIEMIFHAKSLEWYTDAHNSLSLINEEDDLEEFRSSMRQSFSGGRLQPSMGMGAGSRTSLNTTGTDGQSSMSGTGRSSMTSKSGARRSAEPSPRKNNRASRDDDEDEEEENEDEDDSNDDDDDEQNGDDNSDLDDYAKQLNSGRRSSPQRNSGYGTPGARASQTSARSSTLPPQGSTTPKSILRPSSPKV